MPCSCSQGATKTRMAGTGRSGGMPALSPATYPAVVSPPAPLCKPMPACPACGQLECLCRPRWVAGMVVSEADLNRLDYYITAKQRLHNHQLFGTGVACGLVVTCHPCGGGLVNVSPGYALGPCGEDIVVCAEDTVDVCAMIQKCRSLERREVECRPWGDRRECPEVREDWVLAIRYDETPSRNAPMLRADGCYECGCGGDCTCGGSCGGDCGCGGSTRSRQPRRDVPTACAPTVVCETYRYEVFRAPPGPRCGGDNEERVPGRLPQRLQECAKELVNLIQNPPQDQLNDNMSPSARQAWTRHCQKIKATLYEHFTRQGTSHCDQLEELCKLTCPGSELTGGAYLEAIRNALTTFGPILFAAIQDCFCYALLLPCTEPATDPRLPLAVVTVDGHECRIADICNWTPLRRIVGTFPNLAYWLSGFDLLERLRKQLFCFCCEPLQLRGVRIAPAVVGPAGVPPGAVNPMQQLGLDLGQLDLVGKWLQTMRAEPGDLVAALKLAPDPAEVVKLNERLTALETAVAQLTGDGPE